MLSMKHHKTALALVLSLTVASPLASAQNNQSSTLNSEDSIEKQFKQFSEQVEREYTAFEQAVKQAYEEVERTLTPVWGKTETKLPAAKVWTGYTPDLKTRVIVDYDRGRVAVETVERQPTNRQQSQEIQKKEVEQLQMKLNDALKANTEQLDKQDILAKVTKKKLEEAKVETKKVDKVEKQKPMKKELDDLVNKKKDPVVTKREVTTPDGEKKIIKRIEIPMAPNYVRKGAARYQQAVLQNADLNKIDRSLVLSIMKNESAFNPRARSHVPAYGLMQLVPSSGGADAMQEFLRRKGEKYNRKKRPSPSYLYQPERNIELGTTYLNILYFRYMRRIKDPQSRLYCAIAAYNTGAGNVAKAFTGNRNINAAAKVINKMTPKQVYDRMIKFLPYEETQKYLYKVNRDRRLFRTWDEAKKQ